MCARSGRCGTRGVIKLFLHTLVGDEEEGGAGVYPGAAEESRHCEDVGRAISWLGRDGDARSAVHGHPVPTVGEDESVVAGQKARERRGQTERCDGRGERGLWQFEWRCGGGFDYAAGCAKDTIDACDEARECCEHH